MDIFNYEFMRRALLVGFLLSLFVPVIGVLMVSKRLSMVGDALSHTSLAGVSIGIVFNFNPILAAMITAVVAAIGLQWLGRRFGKHSEMGIAIITSAGIGLAGLLSSIIPNATSFNNFLFGSIVSISQSEFYMVLFVGGLVLSSFILFYKEFFLIAFDEKAAKLLGVNHKFINGLLMVLTALTVAVATKSVGALIISSLMVIPVACALQVAKSYKQTVFYSILFGCSFMMGGLFISYYANLKPGGTIVLFGIVVLLSILLLKPLIQKGGA